MNFQDQEAFLNLAYSTILHDFLRRPSNTENAETVFLCSKLACQNMEQLKLICLETNDFETFQKSEK